MVSGELCESVAAEGCRGVRHGSSFQTQCELCWSILVPFCTPSPSVGTHRPQAQHPVFQRASHLSSPQVNG